MTNHQLVQNNYARWHSLVFRKPETSSVIAQRLLFGLFLATLIEFTHLHPLCYVPSTSIKPIISSPKDTKTQIHSAAGQFIDRYAILNAKYWNQYNRHLEGPVAQALESCKAIASLLCADTHTHAILYAYPIVTHKSHFNSHELHCVAASTVHATAYKSHRKVFQSRIHFQSLASDPKQSTVIF